MKRCVPLLFGLPSAALAASGGTLPPPDPCTGFPDTVLVDGSIRVDSIGVALSYTTSLGHHTVEICAGTWEITSTLYVYDDVELSAPDGPEVTILHGSGEFAEPVVYLWASANSPAPSLRDLTIAGGSGDGIQIDTSAPVTLSGLRVIGHAERGIRVSEPSPLALLDSRVSGNGNGGVLLVYHGSIDLTGTLVEGNAASSRGGGIFLGNGGTIVGGEIVGNLAYSNGGGIASLGPVIVSDCLVSGNEAASYGGGIYGNDVVLDGVTVSDNAAGAGGGGVDGATRMLGGDNLVEHNTARSGEPGSPGEGGGIRGGRVLGAPGDLIRENDADLGGGVFLADGPIEGVTLSSNTADDGGGLYVALTGPVEATDVSIEDNSALRGGGVFAAVPPSGPIIYLTLDPDVPTLALLDGTAERNDAAEGGGLWIGSGVDAIVLGGAVRDNAGHGALLEPPEMFLFSSFVDWSGNSPGPLLLGSVPGLVPAEEFACDELSGCTPRQTGGGGDVLQP